MNKKQLVCAFTCIACLVAVTLVSAGSESDSAESTEGSPSAGFALALGFLAGVCLAFGDVEIKISGMEAPTQPERNFAPAETTHATENVELEDPLSTDAVHAEATAATDASAPSEICSADSTSADGVRAFRAGNCLIWLLHSVVGGILMLIAVLVGDGRGPSTTSVVGLNQAALGSPFRWKVGV